MSQNLKKKEEMRRSDSSTRVIQLDQSDSAPSNIQRMEKVDFHYEMRGIEAVIVQQNAQICLKRHEFSS